MKVEKRMAEQITTFISKFPEYYFTTLMGRLFTSNLKVVEDIADQVAQGFVIVHCPCGGDGSSVKNPAALWAFPVNDLRNGLLTSL